MSVTGPYRLNPLREVRSLDERAKRSELASAIDDARMSGATVAAADRVVEDRRAAFAAAREARPLNHIDACITAGAAALAEHYVARIERDLDEAIGAKRRADDAHHGRLGAVDDAHDRHARARAEHEVVERQFARWRAERQKLIERRQD